MNLFIIILKSSSGTDYLMFHNMMLTKIFVIYFWSNVSYLNVTFLPYHPLIQPVILFNVNLSRSNVGSEVSEAIFEKKNIFL